AIDALAVSLLWSFRNPAHERRIAAIARELSADLFISVSHEVAAQVGEYERTVATVLNSYIGPASTRYLATTAAQLGELGLRRGQFLIMQANGGVVPHAQAERVPFSTLDSGPT